jgi:hypothetical protein
MGYAVALNHNGTIGRLYGQKWYEQYRNCHLNMIANEASAVVVGTLCAAQQ